MGRFFSISGSKLMGLLLALTATLSLSAAAQATQAEQAGASVTQAAPQEQKSRFTVGDKTFLLDGKPFVIRAAEIHYARIPRPYWEHRIQMCKAMGMNTICIYIFWNIHEQQPGVFDFTGQNDVAEFCRLAQKHGMYIMVRPGPYVCSEWEMGGLPWWLLKKEDIALRSSDPYFLERTEIFMKAVAGELASLQADRGGNIIMVQVENEYGSYATDKVYVAAIRDILRKVGFAGVPLFQCDWSSNFTNNALDDLLWTINFGAGSNIEQQFRELSRLRPNTPLMCSEYWSGWFDHWGRPHETRTTESLVGGLRDMMERKISFSLYMAHGGTTFGQWGGANSPPFSAMCSSYDYDAPLSEAGWVTPKFHAVRELLSKHLLPGEVLPPIPAELPVITFPAVRLQQVAPLFDQLPVPVASEKIRPMEFFDQGFGTILYRTRIKGSDKPRTLVVEEAHDWAQIFLDGKRIGVLDRRRGEKVVKLPPFAGEAVLDILVEAMGRVNFGKAIHDRKGITDRVLLVSGGGAVAGVVPGVAASGTASGTASGAAAGGAGAVAGAVEVELTGWQVYSFPVDYGFVANRIFTQKPELGVVAASGGSLSAMASNTNRQNAAAAFLAGVGPAYYKGEFTLDAPADLFLDMRSWGKGMIWVNGIALGRFWKIGPQQTLFMPGCWLKKGKNEVIVLDLTGPESTVLAGLNKPIIDMLRPDESLLHRKAGQKLDLRNERPVHQGAFAPGNGWQTIAFAAPVKARYFCLEAVSTHGADQHASIAELWLLDAAGNPLPRDKWSIVYAESEEVSAASNGADKIFDLQESTFWHSDYSVSKPALPQSVVIDLGSEATVSGFRYLPRPQVDNPGMIKEYKIFAKISPFVL